MGILGESSAQMNLFKGSFEEALKKAREEKKYTFCRFLCRYGVVLVRQWPERQVFPQKEVGDYFNSRFICVQVNVEAGENTKLAKSYNITGLPSMVFMDTEGKELRRVLGVVNPKGLVKEAKIALGEELSFEQLYELYKKKKDYDVQQKLLLEAPGIYATARGI